MSFDNEQQQPAGENFGLSGVKNFLMKLKHGWGMVFRLLFITLVGVIGYNWIDPQSLGDIPFSQLTLNQIFSNIFAIGLVLGCIRWFFSFPDQFDDEYDTWADFSAWLLIGVLLWWFYQNP